MSGLDVLRARVVLRDRSVAEVLDLALKFVVVEAVAYAKVALVTILPMALVTIAVGRGFGWWACWIVGVPLAGLAESAFTTLASRLVFQDTVRARDVLRWTLADAARLATARAIAFLAFVAGLLALFVVGLWARCSFFFVGEVMLLERSGLRPAFGRSHRLASAALSDVVLGAIALAVVPLGAIALADLAGRVVIGELLQFHTPTPIWVAYGGVLPVLGLFAQVPFVATARFLLYLNVRTRTEGWDIQTRFHGLAARQAPDAAPASVGPLARAVGRTRGAA